MSKPDHSLDPKILESARQEFLEKGYEKTSLKEICSRAQVTTGALYKRYSGKEELFSALVSETLADMDTILEQKKLKDPSEISDEKLIKAWDMDVEYMMWWFRFLYDRHDGFVLLLKCAEGTAYSGFRHDWVEKMTASTYEYYMEAYRRKLTDVVISEEELHILLSAFWETIYEPFIHGYTWDQLEEHCHLVCRMFDWYRVLHFPLI